MSENTAAATTSDQTAEGGAKPTVVLVHGAFAESASWDGVIALLQERGYPVVAAGNPLRSPASDAAAVRSLVDHVRGPVVLVGHSYGGSVISQAADGAENVRALVYVGAFLPEVGESALELTGRFPGSTLPGALDPVAFTGADGSTGTDLYIRADAYHHQFAADVPADTAARMAATQRPIAQAALEETATVAAWKTLPSWDVVTTADLNIPVAAQRFMAERAGAHVTEVDASHAVAASRPDVVAGVIEQAARHIAG
ncbi:alpha/beta fold hydrolase [Actinacidiphila rubida]|uniref:Pimeloyl-ACP methyl ester carboxylesterase n=1 Tax=Actinacidiphila rubida TaxID=310780 RepID=A0A1H8EBM2_9ACTN|nr:alpha/beta hydrolase [Actinacidiphila rubida]SEN16770.1 Pimeloyl-ACP methyl ester carboxylesterase [Actinacidiphila rubida]